MLNIMFWYGTRLIGNYSLNVKMNSISMMHLEWMPFHKRFLVLPCDAVLIECDNFLRMISFHIFHGDPFRFLRIFIFDQIHYFTIHQFHVPNSFDILTGQKFADLWLSATIIFVTFLEIRITFLPIRVFKQFKSLRQMKKRRNKICEILIKSLNPPITIWNLKRKNLWSNLKIMLKIIAQLTESSKQNIIKENFLLFAYLNHAHRAFALRLHRLLFILFFKKR